MFIRHTVVSCQIKKSETNLSIAFYDHFKLKETNRN